MVWPPDSDLKPYNGGNTTGFSLRPTIALMGRLIFPRFWTFAARVVTGLGFGQRLAERGILPGDILIADAAASPAHGRVAIVMIEGDVLIAQPAYRRGQWWLNRERPGAVPPLWTCVQAKVSEKTSACQLPPPEADEPKLAVQLPFGRHNLLSPPDVQKVGHWLRAD